MPIFKECQMPMDSPASGIPVLQHFRNFSATVPTGTLETPSCYDMNMEPLTNTTNNPTLLVIAYPDLSPDDRARIEQIRAENHPRAAVINAHFTLVFPTTLLSIDACAREISEVTRGVESISFVLRCAIPFPDTEAGATDVFLVPDEGFAALARLADLLYRGALAPVRRRDLPMIPHLTVARFGNPHDAAALADELNATDLAIQGRISAIDLVERGSQPVKSVGRFPLT
jgi:2'-5' RNA ligase